jgi:hypothetical protein
MCDIANEAQERGRTGFIRSGLLCLLLVVLASPASRAMETNGPTILLCGGREEIATNPVTAFMYFVPLISPEPVSSSTSPGRTQSVRMISAKRRHSSRSFSATCEIELDGDGWQQSIFDLAPSIQRHERQLQGGGTLGRQLKSIDIHGAGAVTVEVEGAVSNGVEIVREVRMRFNAHGTPARWESICATSSASTAPSSPPMK